MTRSEDNGGPYEVHCSGVIAKALRRLQRQGSQEGRGERVLTAIRQVWQRLARGHTQFGEPLYRLPVLRMQIRSGVVRPLAVDFGVCEDRPLVFVKGVRLLSKEDA